MSRNRTGHGRDAEQRRVTPRGGQDWHRPVDRPQEENVSPGRTGTSCWLRELCCNLNPDPQIVAFVKQLPSSQEPCLVRDDHRQDLLVFELPTQKIFPN